MVENGLKAKPTEINLKDFVAAVADKQKRKNVEWVMQIMEETAGEWPVMWGLSINVFDPWGRQFNNGPYHYIYESGREGDWMFTGTFSPNIEPSFNLFICRD